MKVNVYLHGNLRDLIGKEVLLLEGGTAYEVLRNLANNYKKQLKAPLDIGKWKIKVKDYEEVESLYVPLYTKELHIYPIFRTAKSQWVQIGIGAVLAVTAVLTGGLSAAGFWGYVGKAAFWAGVSMMTNGVVSLLTPQPTMDVQESQNSKYLGTPGNTTAVGTRIPIGYGLYKVSGHFISYNINSTQVVKLEDKS